MNSSEYEFFGKPMDLIIEPNENGIGALYLGDIYAAEDINLLNKHGIKAVASVAEGSDFIEYPEGFDRIYITADDHPSYDIAQHFQETFDFIEKHRQRTNVLVHCFAGISRSTSCVIAYLMKTRKITYEAAYSYVYAKRFKIQPNPGFVKQLKEFEKGLNLSSQ